LSAARSLRVSGTAGSAVVKILRLSSHQRRACLRSIAKSSLSLRLNRSTVSLFFFLCIVTMMERSSRVSASNRIVAIALGAQVENRLALCSPRTSTVRITQAAVLVCPLLRTPSISSLSLTNVSTSLTKSQSDGIRTTSRTKNVARLGCSLACPAASRSLSGAAPDCPHGVGQCTPSAAPQRQPIRRLVESTTSLLA